MQQQAQQTQELYMPRGTLEIATTANQMAPRSTKNGGAQARRLEKVASAKNATSTTNLGLLKRNAGSLRNIGGAMLATQPSGSAA